MKPKKKRQDQSGGILNRTCRDIIALTLVSELGPRKIMALLDQTRETGEIFRLSPSRMAEITGGRTSQFEGISGVRTSEEYARELEFIEKEKIWPVCSRDENYPENLKNIYDPPAGLYCRGSLLPDDINAVAIVGARKCSAYGLGMAEKLAFDLAEKGITVISGMARGIDSAAHRGALKAGGRTIAVMGSGFRHVYPSESERLVRAISECGAVITEYSSDIMPSKSTFPRRNRIISGMAKAVVVVEAARKSGAMITVDLALQQGREVFAVPGRADFYTSSGTNSLIQNGAKLVMNAQDVLEELDVSVREEHDAHPRRKAHHGPRSVSGEERKVLKILSTEHSAHIDRLSESTGTNPAELPEILLKLEIKGLVKASAGKNYALNAGEYC
ncbi:MAG: DNA-processing protein DprA [Candidatus Omnitrophota bacterium]